MTISRNDFSAPPIDYYSKQVVLELRNTNHAELIIRPESRYSAAAVCFQLGEWAVASLTTTEALTIAAAIKNIVEGRP